MYEVSDSVTWIETNRCFYSKLMFSLKLFQSVCPYFQHPHMLVMKPSKIERNETRPRCTQSRFILLLLDPPGVAGSCWLHICSCIQVDILCEISVPHPWVSCIHTCKWTSKSQRQGLSLFLSTQRHPLQKREARCMLPL